MKKLVKYAMTSALVAGAAVAYRHRKDTDKQTFCQNILQVALAKLPEHEAFVGTWFNMTPMFSEDFQREVYEGGITTKTGGYGFVADAQTGELLNFN